MNYAAYFPRGIAHGNAFCNREQERKRLTTNIHSRQHTLIMSPRRYGKTSLVKYTVDETTTLFGEADLFVAIDAKHIEQQLITGIKRIISNLNTPFEQILVRQPTNYDPATVIQEGLEALDNLLEKKKSYAVFFIDEMQEMGEVAEGKGIEGALRHVAQQTKTISFVFSGSNRRLLSKMFYDRARPLYKLCDRMVLERISKEAYSLHINKYVKQKWNKPLTDEAFDTLMALTERHPFYVNSLCRRLLEAEAETGPSAAEVRSAWGTLVKEERQELARELSVLSAGQRKVLIAIAKGQNKELMGKTFLQKVNLTGSSVSEALKVLEEGDYLEKQNDGTMRFIDPLLLSALKTFYFDEN
jgi:uncharacterized protein